MAHFPPPPPPPLPLSTIKGFATFVYRKNFAISLPPHTHSCHPLSQKMAVFYTFVNRALNICSDPVSFNSEIQYLKPIAFDRGYNPSIVDKAHFKLQNHRISHPTHSNPNINIILPFFSKFQFAKILKHHIFKVIFSPTNKLCLSNLKDPISKLNCWGIYSISCQCSLSYISKQNVD